MGDSREERVMDALALVERFEQINEEVIASGHWTAILPDRSPQFRNRSNVRWGWAPCMTKR